MSRSKRLEELRVETVVELAEGIAGVQASDGSLVPAEALGPGIVKDHKKGAVHVFWTTAQLDTWADLSDIEPAGPGARLIVVFRYDAHGDRTHLRTDVITRAGLTHNWTVELRPSLVIRTLRADGLVWTFDWYPTFTRAQPHGTILEDALAEEDHAEALTVAELARR